MVIDARGVYARGVQGVYARGVRAKQPSVLLRFGFWVGFGFPLFTVSFLLKII